MDWFRAWEFFFRWLHVIAGITWIGHLYFFNFVNGPLQASLDDATKKAVNPQLMPRALWWFRWGAMITFIAGLILFTMIYMYTPGTGFGPSAAFSLPGVGLAPGARWILLGMGCGVIMWFNVWFIIWPAQKALLTGQVTGDAAAPVRKKATLASKINTYLSGPMLFGMLGAHHSYTLTGPGALAILSLVGLAAIWTAYFHAGKVGKLA